MKALAAERLPARFLDTMASACSSVSVVTTVAAGVPHGTTVSAFCSLSVNPPMILVSLDNTSRLLRHVRDSGRFGLNLLASDQSDLARRFATKAGDKFAGVEKLDVLIHSPGGHADAAYRLARYFRGHCKKLNAFLSRTIQSCNR